MRNYLENNKLMCPQQHGFMSQLSTLSNLLLFDELIAQYLNDRTPCGLFLLDFTRASDKVSHSILLNKLISLGISSKLYQWLADFLRDRSQFVSYCGISAESVPVKSGVIQGSVAGPQLFNVMISDLPQCASSMGLILHADDGKAVGSASSMLNYHNSQTDLDAIYQQSESNRLPLNLAKCQCLHIGYGNPNHVYTLGGQPIPVVEQCTDLGLIRAKTFSYTSHINSVICKASRAACLICRIFSTR